MKRCASFLAAWIFCAASAHAGAPVTERAVAVNTDGSLQLEHAGKAQFANILLTDAALAERWLGEHLLQQSLRYTAGDTDRYGRTLVTSDAEEKMLQDGAALIYASEGDVPASWFRAEAAARNHKLGIWQQENLVVTPQNAAQHENEFHVVEGTITRIYEAKTATYLNFGADWHSDFSITIPAKVRRSMKETLSGIKEGSRIRVRGRIYEENGPMVMLNHPQNLEKY